MLICSKTGSTSTICNNYIKLKHCRTRELEQEIIKYLGLAKKVRMAGGRHSDSNLLACEGTMLDVSACRGWRRAEDADLVWVQAGCQGQDLARIAERTMQHSSLVLKPGGGATRTIAGAFMTGNLSILGLRSRDVVQVRWIDARGEVHQTAPPRFLAASMGMNAIVTELLLRLPKPIHPVKEHPQMMSIPAAIRAAGSRTIIKVAAGDSSAVCYNLRPVSSRHASTSGMFFRRMLTRVLTVFPLAILYEWWTTFLLDSTRATCIPWIRTIWRTFNALAFRYNLVCYTSEAYGAETRWCVPERDLVRVMKKIHTSVPARWCLSGHLELWREDGRASGLLHPAQGVSKPWVLRCAVTDTNGQHPLLCAVQEAIRQECPVARPYWSSAHRNTFTDTWRLYGENHAEFMRECATHDPDRKFCTPYLMVILGTIKSFSWRRQSHNNLKYSEKQRQLPAQTKEDSLADDERDSVEQLTQEETKTANSGNPELVEVIQKVKRIARAKLEELVSDEPPKKMPAVALPPGNTVDAEVSKKSLNERFPINK